MTPPRGRGGGIVARCALLFRVIEKCICKWSATRKASGRIVRRVAANSEIRLKTENGWDLRTLSATSNFSSPSGFHRKYYFAFFPFAFYKRGINSYNDCANVYRESKIFQKFEWNLLKDILVLKKIRNPILFWIYWQNFKFRNFKSFTVGTKAFLFGKRKIWSSDTYLGFMDILIILNLLTATKKWI